MMDSLVFTVNTHNALIVVQGNYMYSYVPSIDSVCTCVYV